METARRTASRRSSRTRSGSRPGTPPLHRLLSTHHPDDHSVYHHEDGDGVHVRDTASLHKTETQRRDAESSSVDGSSASSTKEKRNTDDAEHADETTYEGIRGGVPYEQDVENGKPELGREKSGRSVKSPDLVGSALSYASTNANKRGRGYGHEDEDGNGDEDEHFTQARTRTLP